MCVCVVGGGGGAEGARISHYGCQSTLLLFFWFCVVSFVVLLDFLPQCFLSGAMGSWKRFPARRPWGM